MIWWPFNRRLLSHNTNEGGRNSPMIWWPFNVWTNVGSTKHRCRNSPMIWWPFNYIPAMVLINLTVVTHQWSGGLSIERVLIWRYGSRVVTHQWSGDLSIRKYAHEYSVLFVVTHQWSGDLSIFKYSYSYSMWSRNSPMIWWPFNLQNSQQILKYL